MQNAVAINDRFTIARYEPDARTFERFAEEGFRSVVNMQQRSEDQKLGPDEERRLAEAAGLTYLHHPVSKETLSDETVDTFRRRVSELPGPIVVHCASGKRSGALVMMHMAAASGLTGDQALKKAEDAGFECDSEELETFVKSYVDRH